MSRILQINNYYYQRGGSEKYFLALSYALKKQRHKVAVFSAAGKQNLKSEYNQYFADEVDFGNFHFENIIKIFWNFDAARKLEKLIFDFKPDIAHIHNVYHHLSPAVIYVLKKHKIPIVMTLHDYKIICPNYQLFCQGKFCRRCVKGKYYHCFFKKCFKNSRAKSFVAMCEAYLHNSILKTYQKVDLFIAPSRFMRDMLVQGGFDEKKITVLHNFVETRSASSFSHSRNQASKQYILYFGRLSSEKGVDVLLKALPQTKTTWFLKIAGAGPEEKNLKELTKKLNLENQVEFLGVQHGKALEEIIAKAAAIIIPSLWPENMPLVLLEALARGKVVIASRVGGVPEIIKDGENGFLFQTGSVKELAQKINFFSKNSKKIGQNAQKSVKNLNLKNHLEIIEKLYSKI